MEHFAPIFVRGQNGSASFRGCGWISWCHLKCANHEKLSQIIAIRIATFCKNSFWNKSKDCVDLLFPLHYYYCSFFDSPCILGKVLKRQSWCGSELTFNPERAVLFGLTAGGGGGFRPPKISETDWRNIKCVVLVDSYDPPESIGTKKVQTYLVWRHSDVISDVMSKTWKSPKIAKIMVFRYFFAIFSSKVAFFGNDVCQSMLTHVLTPNKPNK